MANKQARQWSNQNKLEYSYDEKVYRKSTTEEMEVFTERRRDYEDAIYLNRLIKEVWE